MSFLICWKLFVCYSLDSPPLSTVSICGDLFVASVIDDSDRSIVLVCGGSDWSVVSVCDNMY